MRKLAFLAVPALLLAACSSNPVEQANQCNQATQAFMIAEAVLAALPAGTKPDLVAKAKAMVAAAEKTKAEMCVGVGGAMAKLMPGPAA